MLELKDIVKIYPSGGENVRALKGVSLSFRNCEFVSVLGPSGCGKTTMLNIIGGLDHYTEGDLQINGRSTRDYKDRDWDTYRNHSIGFVFQSYNLIPHQTVLSNVELALTLSGVSKKERRERAIRALERVGLGSQLKKRPAQMSGGQMQRVAIARAIVNDPDIILADEPTGALDSETSVQVMEILKDISKDRLVIMVTHNPDLAMEYSTRIIRMLDGSIQDDSMPISPEELTKLREEDAKIAKYGSRKAAMAAEGNSAGESAMPGKEKRKKMASMSFATAFGLSLNNLFTKKGRTLLTAFAGSIGIIGIALIYAVSQGTSDYIDRVQEDALTAYPLAITEESADLTSIISGYLSSDKAADEARKENSVTEQQFIASLFGGIGTNDLRSFKAYLEENEENLKGDVNAVFYGYGLTPRIFTRDLNGDLLESNPGPFSYMMGSGSAGGSPASMASSFGASGMSTFTELTDNSERVRSQYDMLMGTWPEKEDEILLVLQDPGQISDFLTYSVGLHDMKNIQEMMVQIQNGETPSLPVETNQWSYEELMSLDFRLIHAADFYRYDKSHKVYADMRDSEAYMDDLYEEAMKLKISGIASPTEDAGSANLSTGFYYLPELTLSMMEYAADQQIVKDQLKDENKDVFSGKVFGEKSSDSGLDFEEMISVDEDALGKLFDMGDMKNIGVPDFSSALGSSLQGILASISEEAEEAGKNFSDSFGRMGKGMLEKILGDQASARVTFDSADALAEDYLLSEEANRELSALAEQYQSDTEEIRKVVRPLLAAMLDSYIISGHPEISEPLKEAGEKLREAAENPPTEEEIAEKAEETKETIIAVDEKLGEIRDKAAEIQDKIENFEETAQEAKEELKEIIEDPQPIQESIEGVAEIAENVREALPTGEEIREGLEALNEKLPDGEEIRESIEKIDEQIPDDISEIKTPLEAANAFMETEASFTAEDIPGILESYCSEPLFLTASKAMGLRLLAPTALERVKNEASAYFVGAFSGLADLFDFNIDEEAIAKAFQFDMSEEDLTRLITALSGNKTASNAASNLRALGYADPDVPSSISVYLKNFEAKDRFVAFIDAYNQEAEESGEEERAIHYTDITGILMSSVTTIIDAVTYVLIAFVAISLIVSSIMIGVITLISVQERTKEIGILRAIGASKRNVSSMFNAETVIIGFSSGLIGVLVTYLLCIPINIILHRLTGISYLSAKLPILVAVILVAISVLLTLVAGIIPSSSAAKKDPVVALRTE